MSGATKDTVREGTTIFVLIRKLWPHFMRQKALFFGTMAAVVFVATASRFTVYLFGLAIDRGLLHRDRNFVVEVAIAYFCLEASRCFLTFLQSYLFEKLGNRILFDIRDDLIRHVQRLPITYFEKNPVGRIVTRLTSDVVSLGDLFTQGLIAIFASLISLVAIIVAMLSISVKMTFLTLLIAPPIVYLAALLSRRILVVLRESKVKMAAINAFIAENISGMKLLQLYGRVEKNTDRFRMLSADYRNQQLKSVRLYALLWPAVSFFNAASVATALLIGGKLTMSGAVTTGAMVAFILHVRAFMDPLNTILEKYQILQNSVSGAERIFTLQEEVPEESMAPAWTQTRLKGDVEFKDVEFKYAPHLKPALRGLNLTVRAGESVALIGRTGSGKSTLITLLQRFYDPTAGSILIDGTSSLKIPRRELRSRIGVVQQDTFMFRGRLQTILVYVIRRSRVRRSLRLPNRHALLRCSVVAAKGLKHP